MRANVLSKQILEPNVTGLSSQQFSCFLGSKVGKALLGLFIFSAIQLAFGAMLPNAFSVAPNAAYGLSVQEALPAGTEVSVDVDAVVVSFAQPMDVAQSLPAADLRIDGSAGIGFDLINASWDMAGLVLTLPLTGALEWGTAYTVNIGGLNSALGIPMFLAHTHIFMTEVSAIEVNPLGGGISLIAGVDAVDAGIGHSIALSDGALWAWGDNTYGQLGLDIADPSVMAPTLIDLPAGVDSWEYFATGYHHTLAICDGGKLWAWGRNDHGQLGLDDTIDRRYPVEVPLPTGAGWTAVAAGQYFTLALCEGGELWSWGNNAVGQLGIGSATGAGDRRLEPEKIPTTGVSGNDWTHIAVGSYHVVAVRDNDSLWAWGYNHGGHINVSQPSFIVSPTEVSHPEFTNVTKWKTIAAGAHFTFALCAGGDLWAWGLNDKGQLGLGTISGPSADIRISPELVEPAGEWDDIAVGYAHALGLRNDGTLWAWGDNSFGRLGIGSANLYEASPMPVDADVPPNEWVSLAAGYDHSLAVFEDGTLWAWGDNTYGQLGKGVAGTGAEIDNTVPWRLAASLRFALGKGMTIAGNATTPNRDAIDVEGDADIVIEFNRPMYTGEDSSGARTGAEVPGTITITIDDGNGGETVVQTIYANEGQWEDCGTIFTAQMNLTAGYTEHTAEVKYFVDDFLRSEMHSHKWTFTTGEIEEAAAPQMKEIAVGQNHTAALLEDGTLWAWGSNEGGLLGIPGGERLVPMRIPDPVGLEGEDWLAVSAGQNHTVALRDDGSLWAWGFNGNGQLGTGDTAGGSTLRRVDDSVLSGGKWTAVSAGTFYTLALCDDGNLYAWGNHGQGRLGIPGVTEPVLVPTLVPNPPGGLRGAEWVAISTGVNHTIAMRSGGHLYAWGANGSGQLGLGPSVGAQSVPQPIGGSTEWSGIVALGQNHTLAICSAGNLYGWGAVARRQLGATWGAERLVPTQLSVPGTGKWTGISAGGFQSFATRDDGTLWAWGDNTNGRLGIDSIGGFYGPREIYRDEINGDWYAVFSGEDHTLAVCDEGTLWSWGNNASGQLGKGFIDAPAGVNNTKPWRIAASIDSTAPYDGEVDVVAAAITITFDRPMRTEPEHRGTITITNGARVNVAAGTWSDCAKIFTVPVTLLVSYEYYEVTVKGFVDNFLGWQGINEMHEYNNIWEFKTGKIIGDDIVYDHRACATCHFTESIRLEHQFVLSRGLVTPADCAEGNDYEYGCQKCHGQGFTPDVGKINWSRMSDCASPMDELNETGCMSCHGSDDDAHVFGKRGTERMLTAHAVAGGSNPGCSGAGCHGSIAPTGFGFGALDLASAHADYWLAVNNDPSRAASPNEYSSATCEDNPFGCGTCHERGDVGSRGRLKTGIQAHITCFDSITCATCHIPPDPNCDDQMEDHEEHGQRVIDPDLAYKLELDHQLVSSLTVTDILRSLSTQVRAELGLDFEGETLEPGVLP